MDPGAFIEAVSNALPKVPSALIAAALLGGPTAIWIIVRFTRPPDIQGKQQLVPEALLWLCTSCRSMNEDRVKRCYRCQQPREAEEIPVMVHAGREGASRIGIAVPLPGERAVASSWLGGEFTATTPPPKTRPAPKAAAAPRAAAVPKATVASEPAAVPEAAPLPGEPLLTFEPLILEPRVKVSGRASATGPGTSRGRRKPQGAGEANSKRNSKIPGS